MGIRLDMTIGLSEKWVSRDSVSHVAMILYRGFSDLLMCVK